MKVLFAAAENAWGGFLHMIRSRLPQHEFVANVPTDKCGNADSVAELAI